MPATMTSCAAPTWAMCIASNGWRTQIRYCSLVLYHLCNFAILMQIDLPLNVFCMCVRAGAGGRARACICALYMSTINLQKHCLLPYMIMLDMSVRVQSVFSLQQSLRMVQIFCTLIVT